MEKRALTQEVLCGFEDYLIREEKSAATRKKYMRDAAAFWIFVDGRVVTKELTAAYKAACVDRGYAVNSVNSMLASVNSLLTFLGRTDCRVKLLRRQRRVYCAPERELTRGEYLQLLEASGRGTRLNAVLQTICATGIRVSELRYFTVEAIKAGEVTVRCKGKTRTVLVPGKLRKLLLSFARSRGIRTGEVFVTGRGRPLDRSNIWAEMKRLCGKAGVAPSKVFPHNLRHLFARTFYAAGKDIAKLADVLGHSSIETTRIYIMSTGEEHRRQLDRMHLVI